jgi:zinc protease
LPPRPVPNPGIDAVVAPQPNPTPQRFTHKGDPGQAYAMIGWSTFGGTDRIRERRALAVAANLLQQRLFNRLREEEGATYSPSTSATSSETFPAWGIFFATAELKPESVETFFRIAREEVARLAAAPVPADEFLRVKNPIVSGIERRLKLNSYWLAAVEDWPSNPALIEQTRSHVSDYRTLTAEEVRAAVAAHVADAGDWSMLVLPEKG